MTLCASCHKQAECPAKMPEFVIEYEVHACKDYITELRIPRGFHGFRKALDKFNAKNCTALACGECLLGVTGLCDVISDLASSCDELFPASAETARG